MRYKMRQVQLNTEITMKGAKDLTHKERYDIF